MSDPKAMNKHGKSSEPLKIFISYARSNMDTADTFVTALEQNNFQVIIDRRDLPYGEKWQVELAEFIRSADIVVWLVSAKSVESKWCNWELGEVVRLNKRLMPVAIEDLPPAELPEALGTVHLLPAEGTFEFSQHFQQLVKALNSDRAWVKEHTRLADRAREWLAQKRSSALLLRGGALTSAESWKVRTPAHEVPATDVLDLILASRQSSTQRQRYWFVGLLFVAAGALSLASLAFWQREQAVTARQLAEKNENLATAARQLEEKQRKIAQENEAQAKINQERAVRELRKAQLLQSQFLTGEAQKKIAEGDAVTAILLAMEGLPDKKSRDMNKRDRPFYPPLKIALDKAIAQQRELRIVDANILDNDEFRFSPDGAYLATADRQVIQIWNPKNGNLKRTFEVNLDSNKTLSFYSIDISPNGKNIIYTTKSDQFGIIKLDADEHKIIAHPSTYGADKAKYCPNGNLVMTFSQVPGEVVILDAKTFQKKATYSNSKWSWGKIYCGPGGLPLVLKNTKKRILLWNAKTGSTVTRIKGPHHESASMDLSPNGAFIAVGRGKDVEIWGVKSGKRHALLTGHTGAIYKIKFSQDSKRLVSTSFDGTVRVWRVKDGLEIGSIGGQEASSAAILSPDQNLVASHSNHNTTVIWQINPKNAPLVFRGHTEVVETVDYSPDGRMLASGANDKTIKLWNVETGRELATLKGHGGTVECLRFSPDGKYIASASSDRSWGKTFSVRIWNVKEMNQIAVIEQQSEHYALDFSPDGRLLAIGGSNADQPGYSINLWSFPELKQIGSFKGLKRPVLALDFSPNGKKLLSSDLQGFYLWDVENRTMRARVQTSSPIEDVEFSPDGKTGIAVDWKGIGRIFDAENGRYRSVTLKGHDHNIMSASYSPDGELIATGSRDNSIRVWRSSTGEQVMLLKESADDVMEVEFSPDGKSIAFASFARTVEINRITLEQTDLDRIKKDLPRCLTKKQRVEQYFLTSAPPSWCLAGGGLLQYFPGEWEGKWPYKNTFPPN